MVPGMMPPADFPADFGDLMFSQPDSPAALLMPPNCLAVVTIIQEAALEPYQGKVAVGKTIRNRMRKRYASDGSVAGTVLRSYQFSGWNTTDPTRIRSCNTRLDSPVVRESFAAWLASEMKWDGMEDVVLYHANKKIMDKLGLPIPKWASKATKVATIGNHLFYKD